MENMNIAFAASDSLSNSTTKYDTSHPHTGHAIIICNVTFKMYPSREVARKDVEKLQKVLSDLGFSVDIHFDKTSTQMVGILKEAAKQDYSDNDCFLCILSSHGDWTNLARNKRFHDVVIGSDDLPVDMRTLCDTMLPKSCPTMTSKPKIFLFQFCRGVRYNTSIDTVVEGDGKVSDSKRSEFTGAGIGQVHGTADPWPEEYSDVPYHIPIKKDYLLHYATTPGFLSFKKYGVGTPFLQAWADLLSDTSITESNNIASIATLVNQRVAETYESYAPSKADKGGNQRRQMPQIISMLTRDFHIIRKS